MCKWLFFAWLLGATVFISACGHKNMIILVPDPDGSVGRITVSNTAGSVEINQPNRATIVRDADTMPGAPEQLSPKQIQDLFGAVLTGEPAAPVHFILHFQSDSADLLPESRQQLPDVVAEILRRSPTHVSVVGHTDTMGDKAYNVDLSLRRALAVRQLLVDAGVDQATVDVSSHGEENPLVKTADNMANAQNRRVEVVVR